MRKKRRKRITIEYANTVEYCGSYEIALARYEKLANDKTLKEHIIFCINGTVVAECIPLVVDGAPIDV